MSKITVAFIKAAMIYFVLAMLLGIHMSRTGAAYPSMPVHVHFNLLGWMSMMIYGVAYHILPRFSGQALWSDKLSLWHFYLANIGLIGMTLGWFVIGRSGGGGAVLYIFSLVEGLSIIFFALNMFKTVKAAPPPPPRQPVRPKPPVKAAPAPEAEARAAEKTASTKKPTAKKSPAAAKKKARPAAKKVKKEEAPAESSTPAAAAKQAGAVEPETASPRAEAEAAKESKSAPAPEAAAEPEEK
ncbi:MAG: cbb3-type cytochrome c oxidase subunit I [Thermodesulfobacteriota bacterium]